MTAPITLNNTLENLEAEYFLGLSAPVQNLPRLAVLHDEIERLKADRKYLEDWFLTYRNQLTRAAVINLWKVAQKRALENTGQKLREEMGLPCVS